ncbi:unnamed protein product [Protopolystoma xenopodis]|uniref:Peptidase A2 domain-containing protein n=1 Tax=Protopolystoma xenopodis TaxID=117903 RepID=A0A3S5BSV2_9PLAT|nr:unnamed protein product [Protopolystoma xenopodis]
MEETLFSTLKLQISVEAGLNVGQFLIAKDGNLLTGSDEATLKDVGLHDNDLLFIAPDFDRHNLDFSSIQLPNSSRDANSCAAESARQMLLQASPYQISVIRERNPELAAAIDNPTEFAQVYEAQKRRARETEAELEQLMSADQLNPNVQTRIAELIQQRNIDAQMETALEHYPETFGQVTMLYVQCRVQGHEIKAFVDSGAQTTIMSENCARRCGLDRLIDKRWAGKAYGVGTQVIIGRVHNSLIEIGNIFIPTSFIVLQDQQLDLLIGLDMLKRHQCTIDLRRNVLIIDGRVEAPFLPESELPLSARHPEMQDLDSHLDNNFQNSRSTCQPTVTAPSSSSLVNNQHQKNKVLPSRSFVFPTTQLKF